jgi:hypothetical protein
MLSLREYERRVKRLQGSDFPDREAAARSLLTEILGIPWQTPEERSAAQHLVAHLYRIGKPTSHPAASPPAPRASASALTADMVRRWKEKSDKQRLVKVG